MIHASRFARLTFVIAAVVVVGGGIWVWQALEPPGWHPGCEELDNGNLAAFQTNPGFGTFQSAVDAVAAPQNRAEG